jgi:phosphohistidine phosphatase
MRHAHAEPVRTKAPSDANRALSAHGRRQARAVGEQLRQDPTAPEIVLSSPLRRAMETAQIVAQCVGVSSVEESALLASTGERPDIQPITDRWSGVPSLLLVGHHPDVGLLANFFGAPSLTFSPGMVAAFHWDIPSLTWHYDSFLIPDELLHEG